MKEVHSYSRETAFANGGGVLMINMVLIGMLAYTLTLEEGGLVAAIPTLGALAIGAQKLLPTMQQAYASISAINGSKDSLAKSKWNSCFFKFEPFPRTRHSFPSGFGMNPNLVSDHFEGSEFYLYF